MFFSILTSVLITYNSTADQTIHIPVEKFKLENGLTVLLHQDRSIPMISYHTWYKVGSRDEKPGVTGATHMLEHMMFKGAKKYSGKEFDQILHENGITNNAFTSWDYTGFYQNLPSSKLELMMDMEVDRMRFLNLSPEDLKSELQVVGEERRWRIDNQPVSKLREKMFELAYVKHPYGWPVIGWMKDIQEYTSEKLRHFYDTFYVPNNAVLVLAGDFDIENTKKLIQKYYGSLPMRQVPEKKFPQEPDINKSKLVQIEDEVQATTVMVGYKGLESGHKDSYALDLLANILGSGSSSRLYKNLIYKKEKAMSAGSYNITNVDPGLFMLYVQLKPGQKQEVATKELDDEIQKISRGVSSAELRKAKNMILKDFVDGLSTIDGKAQALAVNEIVFGDYTRLYSDLKKYEVVTIEDIKRVSQKYLKPEHKITAILNPTQKTNQKKVK